MNQVSVIVMNLIVQIIAPSKLLAFGLVSGIEVVGSFIDDVDALKVTEAMQPAIILLDYAIEQDNTPLYIKSLLIESPDSRVVLLGKELPNDVILNCLMSGCHGYLEWRDTDKFLIKAIKAIGAGEAWFSRTLVGLLVDALRGEFNDYGALSSHSGEVSLLRKSG